MVLYWVNVRVIDCYGGMFIGCSVVVLLVLLYGNVLCGVVVIIVFDGWDSDLFDVLVYVLIRVCCCVELLVWLNFCVVYLEF